MLSRLKANVRELQHFRKGMQAEQERVAGPITCAYDVRLSLGGIADARRAQIVQALCIATGAERTPPSASNLLTMTGVITVSGQPLPAGALASVAMFAQLLRDVDVPLSEIASCPALLELIPNASHPLPAPPRNVKERLGYRLGQKATAMQIAQFDLYERELRRSAGSVTGTVRGWIGNLHGDVDPLKSVLAQMSTEQNVAAAPAIDESLPLTITTANVGSTIGSLMLALREAGAPFAAAPDDAALLLHATIPVAADDPPADEDRPRVPLRAIDGGKR